MLVLGIHIAAAHGIGLGIDEVQLHHTGDVAVVLLLRRALLGGQFEEHTRDQCHLVTTGGRVALAAVGIVAFPLPVRGGGINVLRVGGAHVVHQHVAGHVAQIVHQAVDAEVVAMLLVGIVCFTGRRHHLHQRQLAHAVDGVACVVHDVGHAVAGSLQHHARAIDTDEVGTLQSVQQSAGIDGAHAVELPIVCAVVGSALGQHCLQVVGQVVVFVLVDLVAHVVSVVADAFLVLATLKRLQTGVAQPEVGTLAVGQLVLVGVHVYLLLQSVVVGAVVGNVQLAVAVDQRQVAAAIESAHMLGTHGDEVAPVDVAQSGRHVAEHGHGVGINLIRAHVHIASAEDGVADDDALVVEGSPRLLVLFLSSQFAQHVGGYVVILCIAGAVDGHAVGSRHLCIGLYDHLAVLGPFAVGIYIIICGGRRTVAAPVDSADAIDVTDVSAAEHVAVAVDIVGGCSHLAATDVDLRLSEYIAVGIERTHTSQVVVALAATKHVAHDVTVVYLHVGLALFVGTLVGTFAVLVAAYFHLAAPDGGNLAAAEETVAHVAAIHFHVGEVDTAVVDVATAEHVAAALQTVQAHVVGPGLVVQFLLVPLVDVGHGVIGAVSVVDVADVAVVQRDVGRAEHRTALTAGIDVTLHGGHTLVVAVALDRRSFVFHDADMHVARTLDVVRRRGRDGSFVVTDTALPAAAVDVTARAALHIGIGLCREGLAGKQVLHRTAGAAGIEVFHHHTAVQTDIGGAADHSVLAQAAAVAIACHGSSPVDVHVGIGLPPQGILMRIVFF